MNIEEFLSHQVPLFTGFPAPLLKELITGSRVITFETNEAVIEFGEKGRFLGILLDGEAELSVTDDSGGKHRITVLKPGDLFGATSLMTGENTIADVIGISRCQALLIPQEIFSTKLITQPEAIKYLSREIAGRLKLFSFDAKGNSITARALRKSDDPYGFKLQSPKPLKLLAVNATAYWIRYRLFNTADARQDAWGRVEGIGNSEMVHSWNSARGNFSRKLPAGGHNEAIAEILRQLTEPASGAIRLLDEITAAGHRVVHGGDKFNSPVFIDQQVLEQINALSELAPLDNPVSYAAVKEFMRLLPATTRHVAVFDTAFHQTIPAYAYLYALPWHYLEKHQIRRYGFHGLSHQYAALKAAEFLAKPYNSLEIVTCHLGSGTSLCAIDHGRSVDTSMGFTPAEGLIMATRSGSLDPGVLIQLLRKENLSPAELETLLYKESGLLGLSGISGDLLEIERKASYSNEENRAILSLKTYAYQVRKYIGSYMAAMGGLDVLVFTGSKGIRSSLARSLACQGLECMGIYLDRDKNRDLLEIDAPCEISSAHSQVRVLVVPNEEERMIAREMVKVIEQEHVSRIILNQQAKPIPVEVSAHHIHLTREHVEALYGTGYQLTIKSELSQPGQFACNETVNLSGPKGKIERVRVLGPERRETQVEIAMTEQFKLGIHPPIRQSGDIEGTPGVTIEGVKGSVTITKGVICAMRHIHMTPADALQYGLRDKDVVRIRVEGDRELIFGDVLVRVNPSYRLAMHLDTDEANAANIRTGMQGYIDSMQSRG